MLPKPTTFPEGQRALYGWLIAAAGVFNGIALTGVILLLWLGSWSLGTESQRLALIATLAVAFPLGQLAVIAALAVGGPVAHLRLAKDGTIEADAKN